MKYIIGPIFKYLVSLPIRLLTILSVYLIIVIYEFGTEKANNYLRDKFIDFHCEDTGYRLIYTDFKTWIKDPFTL